MDFDLDFLAESNQLGSIQCLHNYYPSQLIRCSSAAMDRAAAAGYLRIVKWLHINRTEGCTSAAMESASMNGHLNVVMWLYQNRLNDCDVDRAIEVAKTKEIQNYLRGDLDDVELEWELI